MSRRLTAVLAGAVLLACTWAPAARATYPGRNGTLAYQLDTQWVAGNQGSCDDCAGGLSAILRLHARPAGAGFDRCLYATRLLTRCASGSPLTGCVWGSGSDGMCVPLHPSFSPDGRRLVFTLSGVGTCDYYDNGCEPPPGAPHTIVLANADGTQTVPLTRLTASDDQPALLPSGRQLVFAGRPAGAGGNSGLGSCSPSTPTGAG